MATNYNKWDKYSSQLDSEEESEQVQVHRLDKPTSVTIGPKNSSLAFGTPVNNENKFGNKASGAKVIDYKKWDLIDDSEDEQSEVEMDEDEQYALQKENEYLQEQEEKETKKKNIDSRLKIEEIGTTTLKKSPLTFQLLTRNGSSCASFFWNQDQEAVSLNIYVPMKTRAKDIANITITQRTLSIQLRLNRVNIMGFTLNAWELSEKVDDDYTCLISFNKFFKNFVAVAGSSTVISGLISEADKEYDFIDWELKTLTIEDKVYRILHIPLIKCTPASGVYHWWSRVFTDVIEEKEINTQSLADRYKYKSETEQKKSADAWEEANRLFREKMKNK